jgi:hypothetical protein
LKSGQDIQPNIEDLIPKIKGEEVKDAEQVNEFKTAFVSKDARIARTPPEEEKRRYKQQH